MSNATSGHLTPITLTVGMWSVEDITTSVRAVHTYRGSLLDLQSLLYIYLISDKSAAKATI